MNRKDIRGRIRIPSLVMICLSFLVLTALCVAPIRTLQAESTNLVLKVCAGCEIKTISHALELAKPGSVISVMPGNYKEGGLTISQPLSLVGEPGAVIDGMNKSDVLRIVKANGVKVSGFEIINSGKSYIQEFAGIKVEDSSDCLIKNNYIHDSNFGIYLANTKTCSVVDNRITSTLGTEADTGNGIHIWQGEGENIVGNKIESTRDGIYFEFVSSSMIADNSSCGNLRYGLHFMFSHSNVYKNNSFCRNGSGVAVMYSREIEMSGNRFTENQGMASYGLLLKEIRDSKIIDNMFESDSIALYMEGSNRNKLTGNQFLRNGWGVKIMGDCDANHFNDNNFIGNSFDVSTNSSNNPNTFEGNYWSEYDGYDINHDSIGDIPFRLVSLSSVIMERVEGSYTLLRSPLLKLLDNIERALPELIPARMEDIKPRLIPYDSGSASND